ncbi:hypothetical protein AI22_22370 [Pseudomonas aeruginosa YL84]|nr:hypothetical protein AI22_22370 [Pseudomonas aeruginosa YL84]
MLGDSSGLSKLTISSVKATHRERSFGLEPASLPKAFKIRELDTIVERM